MRFALCNEVIGDMTFGEQCRFAAAVGYNGLEVAPFTLGDTPHALPTKTVRDTREAALAAGIEITGLHWLMVKPDGLSITNPDDHIRQTTLAVGLGLVQLCADLGGSVLVHGSPKQRDVPADPDLAAEAATLARDYFETMAIAAEAASVTYCIEPLGPSETNFINTVDEASTLVREVGRPALKTMIDTKAALQTEKLPVPELMDKWLPGGDVAHIQLNDADGAAPGQGGTKFGPIVEALVRNQYGGIVAVEPFKYEPSGAAVAARAIGYLRGLVEGVGR